tara:strand:- start:8022 stop:8444 length:423 start_codon:yes stop_codon:yes gene_type:complete
MKDTTEELKQQLLDRQLNPYCGYMRFITFLAFMPAFWYHAWWAIILVAIASATNAFWFPAPQSRDHFMTRAILGEMHWHTRASLVQKSIVNFLNLFPVFALVWTLWNNMLWESVLLASLVLIHRVSLLAYMARLGEEQGA